MKKWQADCSCAIWCTIYAPNYNCFQFDLFCLGDGLRMDEASLTSHAHFRRLPQKSESSAHLAGFVLERLRPAITLVWQIRNKVQEENDTRNGCLAHVCNTLLYTKVQLVVQHCKLASYCEAKATNLKTANHQNSIKLIPSLESVCLLLA